MQRVKNTPPIIKVAAVILLAVLFIGIIVSLGHTSEVKIPKESIEGEQGTFVTIKGEMGLYDADGSPINTSPIGAFSSGGKVVAKMIFHFEVDFYGEGVDWSSFYLYYRIDMSWPGRSFVATGKEDTLDKGDLTPSSGADRYVIVNAERGLQACFETAGVSLSSSWERNVTFRLEILIKIKDTQGQQMQGNADAPNVGWHRTASFLAGALKNTVGTSGAIFAVGQIISDPARFN